MCSQRIRQKKCSRPPSKFLNLYGNHMSSPSCRSNGARPCSITPNFSIHNGRHSVIGAPFLNSPPFIASALTCGGAGGEDSPTTSLGRQRSSIDSTAELDCIPALPHDSVCARHILLILLSNSISRVVLLPFHDHNPLAHFKDHTRSVFYPICLQYFCVSWDIIEAMVVQKMNLSPIFSQLFLVSAS